MRKYSKQARKQSMAVHKNQSKRGRKSPDVLEATAEFDRDAGSLGSLVKAHVTSSLPKTPVHLGVTRKLSNERPHPRKANLQHGVEGIITNTKQLKTKTEGGGYGTISVTTFNILAPKYFKTTGKVASVSNSLHLATSVGSAC